MSLHSFLHTAAPARPARITIRRRLLGRGSRLRSTSIAAALLSLGLASFQPAHAGTSAGTITWNGLPGDWFAAPSHWSNGSTPTATDDALNSYSTAAMTLGQSTTVNSFFSNGAFTLNGGTFSGNKANAASLLTVNNVFTLNGGTINNFTIQAGAQQTGQPAPTVVVASNGNNLFNNTTLNGNLDMTQAGNGAYLRLTGTDTVNGTINLATINTDGYGLRLGNAATLVLSSGSSLVGYGRVSEDTNPSTLTNNGLVNATGALVLNQSFFNNAAGATAEATGGGSLSLNNTIANSGMIKAVGAGSIVSITGTFTGTGSSATNQLTASGGGQVQINGASLLGTINTGAAALVLASNNNNLFNNTTLNGNLDMTQAGNGAYLRLTGTDTVNGNISLATINTDGYGLRLGNAATLVLSSGSSLVGYGRVSEDTNPSTLTNNGLVNATGALVLNQSFFNNAAGATAEATGGGSLSLNNTIANSGMIKAVGAGSIVSITGSLTATGSSATNQLTASGGGQVQINGASLLGTINTGAAALVLASNNNNLFNNTTLNGNLDMTQAGNGAYLRLTGTDTVNGNISLATLNSDGYGLRLGNAATLVLSSGSSLVGYGHVSEDTNPSTLTNNGLVNANSAGNTLVLNQTTFNNAAGATAEATGGGSLSLNNTTNNSGMIKAVGAGSIVSITGSLTATGSSATNLLTASGGGQINVNNATLLGTINTDAATALVMGSSGNNLFNNTTLNGNLDMTQGGNGAYLRLLGTDTVNGNISLATLNSDGYGLRLGNAATLVLSSGSSLVGYGHVSEDTNPSTLTNNGLVNANSAGNTLVLNQTTFNNAAGATAEATGGGSLSLNNTTNNSGMIKAVGAGSIVSITGTFTGTGNNLLTASGGGQINVNNATLLGTINTGAAALVMGSSGNNLFNNTTLNGNLDMTQGGNGAYLRLLGTDTVNGNINLATVNTDGYGLRLGNAATLVLSSGSSLVGYGHVSEDTNPSTLTNNGLVNANSAGNTLVLNQTTFKNTGTAQVTNGATLVVSSNSTNSGVVNVQGGGTANFSGLTQTAGLTQVDGVLNLVNTPLALKGGVLDGSGTINGNVVNTNGIVSPGDSPGTLTINGNYTQGSTGTLNIEFTNSLHDLLNVSGIATTGGILDVNYIDTSAFIGSVGSQFAFLDYGTLAAGTVANFGFTVTGHNGFAYTVVNDASNKMLDLRVAMIGSPAPAVPEASTTVSLGLLLLLGLGGTVVAAKRKKSIRA